MYDAVYLYASVLVEHRDEPSTPQTMLERLLNKSSFNSGSTEEVRRVLEIFHGKMLLTSRRVSKPSPSNQVHLSHGRPRLELQIVAYESTVPKVVFVLGSDTNEKLVQVRHINWIEGHAPDDQPWGDPGKNPDQES